jgi:hypothetical protein
MNRTILVLVIALLLAAASGAHAQFVSEGEALDAARAWVSAVVGGRGAWGGASDARVESVVELRQDGALVGYICPVSPSGFVAVSLRRELAPVQAYSETSPLDVEATDGPSDLLKRSMKRIVDAIEDKAGPIRTARSEDVVPLLEIDYREAWDDLDRGVVRVGGMSGAERTRGDYQEGEVLVPGSWHQNPPYNDDCPSMGCSYAGYGSYNTNAVVGCVATAGSQIMHYWGWPRYGVGSPYDDTNDWPNMLDTYTWRIWPLPAGFVGPDMNRCTQAQIDAVAELCSEVGVAVEMAYTCSLSSSYTDRMEGVYENHYRYSTTCAKKNRPDFTAVEWFDRIKAQINANRPIHYRILGHSIVADGWQMPSGVRQYHMNYGWNDSHNMWYTVDALHYPAGGTTGDEYMLESIYPAAALGTAFAGSFPAASFPDRYFDRDSQGSSATFAAGQHLHFLPGVVVTCASGSVALQSTDASPTRLYGRGYLATGAVLRGGTIKLSPGGQVSLR